MTKIAIVDKYLAIRSMTGGVRTTTATVHGAVYYKDRHTSMNLVHHNQHGRPQRREDNRTKFNCKSEVEVANNRRLCCIAQHIVLLKLTTDRHEASRGPSVTNCDLLGM